MTICWLWVLILKPGFLGSDLHRRPYSEQHTVVVEHTPATPSPVRTITLSPLAEIQPQEPL